MNLHDQVCSLEHAKKLKDLGIDQNSLFTWYEWNNTHIVRFIDWSPEISGQIPYSAFTASELIQMLPNAITLPENIPFNSFRLRIEKSFIVENGELENIYLSNYRCDSTECTGENAWFERTLIPHNVWDKKFPDCLAKVLIYLIENGLMKI